MGESGERLVGGSHKANEFLETDIDVEPWWVVQADDKKEARLNCIHHLLGQMPYQASEHAPIDLPERESHQEYVRQRVPDEIVVPEVY